MKLRIAFPLLLAALLSVVPAAAQVLYSNGPINGETDAWTINFGFAVSDTFTLSSASTVSGVSFGAWLFPGDVLENVDVAITSSEFGGTTYSNQVVNINQGSCNANEFGFNVCMESSSGMSPVNLAAGTYWLNLQNAVVNTGDPIFWDENSGPSLASGSNVGTIPSESFTVLGTSSTTTSGTTPEPSSLILFGSGIFGLAGVIRRKLL